MATSWVKHRINKKKWEVLFQIHSDGIVRSVGSYTTEDVARKRAEFLKHKYSKLS